MNIGIEESKTGELIESLNELLANYQITYQNLRGSHWNVRGRSFFELHVQFENMYNASALVVDAIAERILTLGGEPMHRMEDYLRIARIKESGRTHLGEDLVKSAMMNFTEIIRLERSTLEKAQEAGDESTATLLTDDLSKLEKQQWMLRAYLG
jgi:starvation-inducible DNA-binding protein